MSLYQASVPVFVRGLNVLAALLEKPSRMPAKPASIPPNSSTPGWRRTCILCLARSSAPATRPSSPRSVCRGSRRRSFPTMKPRWRSCASAWPTPSPICRAWRRRLRRRRKPQGHAVVRRLQARVPGRRLSAELRAAELLLPRRHRLRHPAQPGREDRQAGFSRAVSGLEPGLSAAATSGRRSRPSFPCSGGFPPASGRACAWPWTSGGRTDPPAGRSGRPRTCRPPAW